MTSEGRNAFKKDVIKDISKVTSSVKDMLTKKNKK